MQSLRECPQFSRVRRLPYFRAPEDTLLVEVFVVARTQIEARSFPENARSSASAAARRVASTYSCIRSSIFAARLAMGCSFVFMPSTSHDSIAPSSTPLNGYA